MRHEEKQRILGVSGEIRETRYLHFGRVNTEGRVEREREKKRGREETGREGERERRRAGRE